MANCESWTNLGSVGRLLFIQKYAIEEIDSLVGLKIDCKTSVDQVTSNIDQLRRIYNLFTYNQDEINNDIDPIHCQGQLALAHRVRKKVTSRLIVFEKILSPDQSDSNLTITFPKKWTSSDDLEDWIGYEDYLILKQQIRDFNILCSSVPQDKLPMIKQFRKEGASVNEIEDIVVKLRSNSDFEDVIEAEIQKVENYSPFNETDALENEFIDFVKIAKQTTRFLRLCNDEESNYERSISKVHRVTRKFPRIINDKWMRSVSLEDGEPLCMKLHNFLNTPVCVLLNDDKVGWWSWLRDILAKISSKILSRTRTTM